MVRTIICTTVLFLVACQSTPAPTPKPAPQLTESQIAAMVEREDLRKRQEDAELKRQEDAELNERIANLKKAGEGRVEVCRVGDYSASTTISFSTRNYSFQDSPGSVEIYVADIYNVNSALMILSKEQSAAFLNFLVDAQDKASNNMSVEELRLGAFKNLELSLFKNRLWAYWKGSFVDRIFTEFQFSRIYECVRKTALFL